MTIEISQTSVQFHGNDQASAFDLPFPILGPHTLLVARRDPGGLWSELVLNMDYYVELTQTELEQTRSAMLTLPRPLPNGYTLSVSRRTPISQDSLFYNQGPNSPKVIEESLDKAAMICQELAAEIQELPLNEIFEKQAEHEAAMDDFSSRLKQTMPPAPTDGNTYLANGSKWVRFDPVSGGPFRRDEQGYVSVSNRSSYLPSHLWHIGPRYVSAAPAAAANDQDSLFVVDSEGFCTLK